VDGHGHRHGARDGKRSTEIHEIGEAILLAIIAIATAWSGYQAAKWGGREAELYGQASKYRVEATRLSTLGGQARIYDVMTFNSWLQAGASGDEQIAAMFERRFTPEYRVAFDAWLKTDPFNDPTAPPGPIFMPEYHNSLLERAAALERRASSTFDEGTASREQGDDYVRVTVLLATVLFLIAVGQRFKIWGVRVALFGVAVVFLSLAIFSVATYPHL
jgi:hypothetical protein